MADHTKQSGQIKSSAQDKCEPENPARAEGASATNPLEQQSVAECQSVVLEASTAVELAMEGISKLDDAGCYVFVNQQYAALLDYHPDDLIGQSWEITVHPDDRPSVLTAFARMLEIGKAEVELRGVKKDGGIIYKRVVLVKHDGSRRRVSGHFCFVWDVTERKREEALHDAEKQALELVAKGETLECVLGFVCQAVESLAPPMLCSVMLADEDGAYLSLATAPNLPDEYNRAIKRIPIGPMSGSCGSAAYFQTPTIVRDIATDPLWKDYASVALTYGLKACWSLPIISSNNRVLGTLAVYHDEPQEPQPADLKILGRVCQIAALIIQHTRVTTALQESEGRFQAFMRHSPAVIFIKDGVGRYVYVNSQFETLSHISREEAKSKTVFDFLPMDTATRLSQDDEAVLAAGQILQTEVPLRDPDGTVRDWLVIKFPLTVGQRPLLGGIAVDITERKRLEQANQDEVDRLRLATDIAQLAIWDWNILTNQIIWSENCEEVKGLPRGSFDGTFEAYQRVIHPEDLQRLQADIQCALSGQQPYRTEHRIILPTGEVQWVEGNGVVYRDGQESPIRMVGTLRNITERKRIEQAMQLNEDRFARATAVGKVGVWELDVQAGTYYGDKNLKAMFGYEPDELSVDPLVWLNLVHPEDQAIAMAHWQRILRREVDDYNYELRMVRKDGTIIWTDIRGHAVSDGDGQVTHLIGATLDITARKQTDENLRRTQFAMDEAVDAVYWIDPQARILYTNDAASTMLGYTKEEFLRMTVHDLNPEFPVAVWPGWWAEMRDKKVMSLETVHLTKNGRRIPIDIRVAFLAHDGQEFHCAFVRDIGERKRDESAMKALVRGTGAVTGKAFFPVFVKEIVSALGVKYAAVTDLHGNPPVRASIRAMWSSEDWICPAEYALAGTPCEVVVRDGFASYKSGLQQLFPNNADLAKFGAESYLGILLRDGSGAALGHICVIDDKPLSELDRVKAILQVFAARAAAELERSRIDEALRASQERFELAVRGTRDGIWDWNILTGGVSWSERTVELLGEKLGDVVPSHGAWRTRIHPTDVDYFDQALRRHLDHHAPYDIQLRVKMKDGTYRWFRDQGQAVWEASGRPVRMVGSISDITDQRNAEEALWKAHTELEQRVVERTIALATANSTLQEEVAERKRIEDRLERTQYAVDHAGDQIFVIGSNGHILDVNESACCRLGYTKTELLTMSMMEIDQDFPPEAWAACWAQVRQKKQLRFETRHRSKSGEIYPVEVVANYLCHNGQELDCAIVRDVTERRRIEDRLKRTQYAVDHAADQIFIIGSNGYFLDANESACCSLGYSKEELLTMSVMDIDPDCSLEVWRKMWEEFTHSQGMRLERRHRSKTGAIYPVEVLAKYLLHNGQELSYSTVRDITERQRTEEVIRESELRYKLLTEATFDGIAIHDQGILLEVNTGLERMFGYESGELIGRSMWDLIAEESHEYVVRKLQDGASGPYEFVGRRKDGSPILGEVVARPYRYRGQDVRLVAGRDITGRKQLEFQMTRHTEELARQVAERTAEIATLESQRAQVEKLAAVGQLAAAVAHEINNPLAGIKNAFTLVKQAVDRAHPHAEFVEMIDREIARVAAIVRNMYQLYRKEPSRVEAVDLQLLCRDLEELFAKRLSQQGILFSVSLPPSSTNLVVPQSDLLQVLMNLIQNAIDSSAHGRAIRVKVHQDQSLVVISVSDEGDGISPDVLPHIFDPFFTTKTEKDQKGMGLGLSVSQSLVMAMGGRIDVQTEPGSGSTFSVVLPQSIAENHSTAQRNIIKEVLTHET